MQDCSNFIIHVLLTQWSYCSLALSHRHIKCWNKQQYTKTTTLFISFCDFYFIFQVSVEKIRTSFILRYWCYVSATCFSIKVYICISWGNGNRCISRWIYHWLKILCLVRFVSELLFIQNIDSFSIFVRAKSWPVTDDVTYTLGLLSLAKTLLSAN